MKKIELLAPAKNLECGIEAVKHGADAVYIGAPKFGARAAAGNSLQDIELLASYTHRFNARVYITLNTILTDKELGEAQRLIWDLYHAGADAIIVQDMGILQLDLPPIALHASTQTDNRSLEKVLFLEKAGFSQIVLARELSVNAIKQIASQVNTPLEVFVHGALCVCYSGQCYMSEAFGGRSANRGECAQCCRLPYDLVDVEGNTLAKNQYLLSLKDLNLSDYLEELLHAGVSSFKIEGRLKDAAYVKNVTAFYRKKLDDIFEKSNKYQKSSSGTVFYSFQPNLQKTFHRGSTDYFLHGRNIDITSFDTAKSKGEFAGKVSKIGNNYIVIEGNTMFHNGDGVCFLDTKGNFNGFRINKVEGERLFPTALHEIEGLETGTEMFRNLDFDFIKTLEKETAKRKIAVDLSLSELPNGFMLNACDEDNNTISLSFETKKEEAQDAEKAAENIKNQLSKLGNTDFHKRSFRLLWGDACFFIPNSLLSDWRRKIVEALSAKRADNYVFLRKKIEPTTHPYPTRELTYLGNVHNEKAKDFYTQHGVNEIAASFEKEKITNVPLMFTKHCLKFSLGLCGRSDVKEPLFLIYRNEKLRLEFDCNLCEMRIQNTSSNILL
ncbi:MAG: U32 family peptidase [Lentimicrobiaceae bacterium]|nr:U32 family peptidase [Lentimicrobiaceae bacterium]